MKSSDEQLAEELKSRLRASGILLARLIVYGARARGDAGAESDFDVLVLVDTLTKEMRRTISDCAWEVGFDAGVVITPVVMTREEAEESPERSSLFMVSVRKEGIPV